MLSLPFLVLFIGAVSTTGDMDQAKEFKAFLETVRNGDGSSLEERMAANPVAKPWENSGKFQGDILVDDDQAEDLFPNAPLGRNAFVAPNTKWPSNIIVYEFGAGEFDREQQEAIGAAMRDVETNTCVRFRARGDGELNFVKITGRPDGCYANVGYGSTRGVHILNLARARPGRGCFTHTVMIHEWLHVLGFFHMQSTYDRDTYVKVMWENIIPGMEFNFDKYETSMVNNLGLPYEYASTMHYGPYGFSSNGQPTMIGLFDWKNEMGQLEYVTKFDWLRANRHYNCPGAWSSTDELQEEVIQEQSDNVRVDNVKVVGY